jgi:hypothetical protein
LYLVGVRLVYSGEIYSFFVSYAQF